MGRFAVVAVVALAGCVPSRTGELACSVTDDCKDGRICDRGFCVVAADVADAARDGALPDMPPDADPFAITAMMCMAAGYTADTASGGLYRVVTASTNWLNAQADCKKDVADATHLVVLSKQEEVTFLMGHPGWIGLSDRQTEGAFVSVTNENDFPTPFANGQPDNGSGSEDCAEINSNGKVNDDQCNGNKRYVCECDGRASMP